VKPDEVTRLAAKAKRTALEDRLLGQLLAHGVPKPEREYRFEPARRWRFDFAWPDQLVAVEVDGGEWVRGHHWRPEGVAADREKTLAADRLGWTVLHFTGTAIRSGEAVSTVLGIIE